MSLYPEGTAASTGDKLLRAFNKILERSIELYGGDMSSPYPEGVAPSTGDNLNRVVTKILCVLNSASGGGTSAAFASLDLSSLPTSNPGGGKPWLNGGVLQIGT